MKGFLVAFLFFAVSANTLVPTSIRPVIKHNGYLPLQSSSDNELGITQYPDLTYLPEATQRLLDGKASTWLVARVYHTDDSIKEVTKYFRAQAHKVNRPVEGNALLKSLLRDNWKMRDDSLTSVSTIFGLGEELRSSGSADKIETSFGVIVLDDSFVRVHLMSPHATSANNNKLAAGTMIMMVRERLNPPAQAPASESGAEREKVYKAGEVTRRARVTSKPEPEGRPGVYGAVVLIAVLSSSGKVTNIRVVAGLPEGLTQAVIEAAEKIKFEPAIKDGRYVSQWVRIEYHFR